MNIGEETELVEFKKSTGEHREAMEAISAILNKHGQGSLYFGVNNDGEVVGQEVSDKTLRQVGQWIADKVEPTIHPVIEKLDDGEGHDYIHVQLSGNEPPYSADGRYFIRVGTRNDKLSPSALNRFAADAYNRIHPWDGRSSGKTVADVDEKTLRKYYERGVKSGRLPFEYKDSESCLSSLHLLCEGDTLTNAAAVCFVPTYEIMLRMGVFADSERVDILDNQQVSGTLFSTVDAAELYILNNTRRAFIIDGSSLHREEVPEIPMAAVREALFNAFCHRDYQDNSCVQVDIFWDHVNVFSPGRFPEGVTPEDYLSGKLHESKGRNKLLAETLYKSGDIESFATGLRRIKKVCDEAKVPFEVTQSKTGVNISFVRAEGIAADNPPTETDKKPIKTDKKPIKTDYEDRKVMVKEFLASNQEASNSDISNLFGLGPDRTKAILRQMVSDGLLVKVGDRKSTRYRLANQ